MITVPTRNSRITFDSIQLEGRRTGIVRAFNYCFERIDAVYVDVDEGPISHLVWLYQIIN